MRRAPVNVDAMKRVEAAQVGSEDFKKIWAEESAAIEDDAEREAFDRAVQHHIDMVRKGSKEAVERYIQGDPAAGSPPHPRSSIERK